MRQYHIAAVVVTTTTTTSTPTEGQEHLKMLISYSNETMHRLLVFRCKQTPACLGSTEQTAVQLKHRLSLRKATLAYLLLLLLILLLPIPH